MKVCAVTTWPPHRDGVALYSAELYTHISELVDIKVIANIPKGPHAYKHHRMKERIVLRCWKRGGFTYPLHIFRSALKERPNVLHLQYGWLLYGSLMTSILFPFLLFLFRLSRRPCVVTMHTVIRRNAHIYDNPVVNLLARMAILFISKFIVNVSDRVIVHNHLMKKALQKEYALQREEHKIVVIPHGVKKASKKIKMSKKDEEARILSLGFIRRSKGIEHLLEAFEKFYEHHPDAKLVIIGGRHAHDTADHVRRLKHILSSNLSKCVLFTDFIDEESLDRLIWTSDVIVLSSLERYFIESSGALTRVADFGKPIVCSRVPKFESELQDGEDCIMIKPGDITELAQALVSLTQNDQLRKKIGENLRKKFKNRYWSNIAIQHLNLYKAILKTRDLTKNFKKLKQYPIFFVADLIKIL